MWEKIFANHISEEGLAFGIYKELSNSTLNKKIQPNFKWAKYMKEHLLLKEIHRW